MSNSHLYSEEDFQTIKKLGQGSFSTVRLVKRKADGQLLALKQVSMDKLTMTEKNLALNEVRLLASISSPFIVAYHGSFFSQKTNSLCLLMQYAEEGDLEGYINRAARKYKMKQGLPEQFIWRTIIHVLQGLRTMHCNKMAHRDLKSANIFFSQGVAKLGDLNVSIVSDASFYQTKTGTPYYTAPQIWKGDSYTNSCDIWSLGCIIYEMCALLPPFKAANFPELFIMISKGQYQPLSEEYSEELRTLVRLCLNTVAEERPSAIQLLQNPIIVKKQVSYQSLVGNKESVKLVKEIKCPRRLRFINDVLPGSPGKERRATSISRSNSPKDLSGMSVGKIKTACFIRVKKSTLKAIEEPNHDRATKSFKRIKEPSIYESVCDNSRRDASSHRQNKFRLRAIKKEEKENIR